MKMTALLFAFFCFFFGRSMAQQADSLGVTRAVDSLIQISRTFTEEGDFDKALEVNAVAEKMALEKLGKETAGYGKACFNRGRILYISGDYQGAEKYYLESLKIQFVTIGENHIEYSRGLSNLALLYSDMGKFDESEPLYVEALKIQECELGRESEVYARTLHNFALYYFNVGKYDSAEIKNIEAKEIREKVLGKDKIEYGATLENLAIVYSVMGKYGEAEQLLLEAKTILENNVGKENSKYALILNNLANLYLYEYKFKLSEETYIESKITQEKISARESLDYAATLQGLAILYSFMGIYNESEKYHLQAMLIEEGKIGKENMYYVSSLHNLGGLYQKMKKYNDAENLYLEALKIEESLWGKESVDYANTLNSLATLYDITGRVEDARVKYLNALSIIDRIFGREHPDYIRVLLNLTTFYQETNQKSYKIDSLFLQVKTTSEKILGKGHSNYLDILNHLSNFYYDSGRLDSAELYFQEAQNLSKLLLVEASLHLANTELFSYIDLFLTQLNRNYSYTYLFAPKSSILRMIGFENAVFYKGYLLAAVSQMKNAALTHSLSAQNYSLFTSYHRRLANQYALPIAERDSALVVALEEKASTLEKELVRTVAGFGDAMRQVNWQEVQARLKPGEAAIEFVDFRYSNPDPTDSTMYAALLLRPDWDAPRWVGLFEQYELAALLAAPDPQNNLYSPAQPSILVSDEETPTLYELLWAPLDSLLAGVNTVYYSPSGLLHRLNFDAIPSGRGTLADRYTLHRLNSTRELVIPTEITTPQGPVQAVVYGGIQYGMDSTAIRNALAGTVSAPATTGGGELPFSYADGRARGAYLRSIGEQDTWTYLPGTDREAVEVSALLTAKSVHTTLRKGYAANEESFKQIGRDGQPSPRILHIATHGFFFPDPKDTVDGRRLTADGAPAFKISDHPMIRSGLILAGANTTWAGQSVPTGLEDGILTAYEISQMNLRNTELVVLSACETGLGDIQGNEGVYGLQRAFKIAGAKYLLMSLWKVPDAQTRELMTLFYREYTGGKAIPEAFRTAQAAMRKRYPDRPVLWAGFVLVE